MTSRIPKYRRQPRPTGAVAFVELNGQRRYLGTYGSEESKQCYARLLAEWTATGRQPVVALDDLKVAELAIRFWRHAEVYYRGPNGTPTSSLENVRQALHVLKELYQSTRAAQFGPRALAALQQAMIDRGWCRTHINKQIAWIKHVFKWGVAQELVPAPVHQALQAVPGLKRGRSAARETEPVRPVPQAHIDAIKPHVSSPVWALVQLQLATSARAGELVRLRAIDLDTTGPVWIATLADHKTAHHHGRERRIYLGPRAQEVVKPFMAGRALDAPLFNAREGNAERKALGAHVRRRPGQAQAEPKTDRHIHDGYSVASYRRAVERACQVAGVPRWTPHRLRHNAATEIRKRFGIEAAQLLLGHARADITQVYAEVNEARAVEVALKIG